ncbi:MAG: LacI family DNA-binding transcriptional regulator [Bacteroidota bacterium]
MERKRISLRNLAEKLNLSISTVSRALRGVGEVNPSTRQRVLELARQLNYHPNPLALGLLHNQTQTIGVILPEIENYYYSTILRGIDSIASSAGYRIITMYSNDFHEREVQAIEELMQSLVDGILLCPAQDSTDYLHLQRLINDNFPVVLFERSIPELTISQVVTNNYQASYELADHLIERGCRRIAFITSLEPLSAGNERYKGYLSALKKHNLQFNRELIIHGNLNISTSIEATKNLLQLNPIPDAIIGNSDTVAMASMKVIKEAGLIIPDDIALAGFSDDPFSSFLEPSLTSVSQPAYLIGMRSMELLLKKIKATDESISPHIVTFESALVCRESTGHNKQ